MIALTGGSGFLGSHVADALLAAGHEVRVSVRPSSGRRWLENKDLDIQVVDLNDLRDCERFLTGTDHLVHCAGVVSAPDETAYTKGNVDTTKCLLAAARHNWGDRADATFLLVSSLAAHGPAPLGHPAVESSECNPITAYGRSKLVAEGAVESAAGAFRRVILRPPSLYGPRDRAFLPLIKAATRGWTARPGNHLTGLSLVDGRDAAQAILALLRTTAATGVYFVSDAHTGYDWRQLQGALAAAVGRPVRRVDIPLFALRAAAFVSRMAGSPATLPLSADRLRDLTADGWVCDGRHLTDTTGFTAQQDASSGFRETLAFYREQGWL